MRIHLLGICGTFMAGLARLARELGDEVSGADSNVYPPMSTQLRDAGIAIIEGYDPAQLEPPPDALVVGNALSRGNPCVEAMLERGLDYLSGPEWLYRRVLRNRTVIAVAGTHGKTTTASMLAWVLDQAGRRAGFLIGGVPANFGVSARLGDSELFVVEADEYDTAFFDKRSKFVHYRPRIAVLNNLEFDHADIFDGIAAIRRQFHHLVRTVPGSGRLLVNADDGELEKVLDMGCWTPVERFAADGQGTSRAEWTCRLNREDGSDFDILKVGARVATVRWPLFGRHNVMNALAAVATAAACGVTADAAAAALASFRLPRRRLDVVHDAGGVVVFEDFAHHPTAIRETLAALRSRFPGRRLLAVLDPRSNTMRMGIHGDAVAAALAVADVAWIYARDDLRWQPAGDGAALRVQHSVDSLVEDLVAVIASGDRVALMSNGSFDGLVPRLLARLDSRPAVGVRAGA